MTRKPSEELPLWRAFLAVVLIYIPIVAAVVLLIWLSAH
jgi:hypothetical protein